MKYLIQLLMLITFFNFDLYGDEGKKEDRTVEPRNFVYIRNINNVFTAYEEEIKQSFSRFYSNNGDEKVRNLQIGVLYNFEDSNFSIESRFQELRKGNYSSYANLCSEEFCFQSNDQIGSYFRNEFVGNGLYNIFNNLFFLKFRIRYIKSELSDSDLFLFRDSFSQYSIGPNIGIKFNIPIWGKLRYVFDIEAYYNQGRINHSFSNVFPNGSIPFTNHDGSSNAIIQGEEFNVGINYDITSQFYIGWGFGWNDVRIRPRNLRLNTLNIERNIIRNLEFELNGGTSFTEYFSRKYIEIGIFF